MPLALRAQQKAGFSHRARPSQASLKLPDLFSILLILKENKLHKWDRWFLFVMTVAILSPPPPLLPSSSLSAFLWLSLHLLLLLFFLSFLFCPEMATLCNANGAEPRLVGTAAPTPGSHLLLCIIWGSCIVNRRRFDYPTTRLDLPYATLYCHMH